jgi:predicted fused transcriptional regulator/phosphomethylpyrimidine kinase
MFRNFSEALGAWSGWVIDQAAKEVVLRGGGGSDRDAPRGQTERFQTASGSGTGAACVVGVSPFDPINDTVLLTTITVQTGGNVSSSNVYNNVRIKNATTGFYLGIGTQSVRDASNALIFRMGLFNSGNENGTISLTDSSGATQYFLNMNGLTSGSGSFISPRIKRNTDNTFTIASDNTYRLLLEPAPNNTLKLSNIGMTYVFTKIACGDGHIIGLASDGKMYAWGSNQFGQLGTNARITNVMYDTPAVVAGNLGGITDIACGKEFSAAISNGRIYTWGNNSKGQLGVGRTLATSTVPRMIDTISNCTAIACGDEHMIAIAANNRLFGWGDNTFGQIGNGTNDQQNIPVEITRSISAPIMIACGPTHSFAVNSNKRLVGWGKNTNYELGINNNINQNVPIEINLILLNNVSLIAAGTATNMAVSNGRLYQWGGSNNRTPRGVDSLTNTTAIACGSFHNLAVSNGKLYAWGNNSNGQLGNNTTTTSSTPVEVAGNLSNITQITAYKTTSFALANNKLYVWGQRPSPASILQIYLNNSISQSSMPFLISGPSGETTIDSRWIFEIPDDPLKCAQPKQLIIENIAESIIVIRTSTAFNDPFNLTRTVTQTLNINGIPMLNIAPNSNFTQFRLYEIFIGGQIMSCIDRGVNGQWSTTADVNIQYDSNNLMTRLGVNRFSQLSTMKFEIVRNKTVLHTGEFKRTPPIQFPPAFPGGRTRITTFDNRQFAAVPMNNTGPDISFIPDVTRAYDIEFIVRPNTTLTSTNNLSLRLWDPAMKGKIITPPYTGILVNYTNATNNSLTSSGTPINLYFVPQRDASGAYTFYLIPTDNINTIFILNVFTRRTFTGAIQSQQLQFTGYNTNSALTYPSSNNSGRILMNHASFLSNMFPNNEHKFWLDDRCNTVSCSNRQASLTASHLPWNSATLTECTNCTPPTSFDPCSASGVCKTEQGRRTASRLKWSSSDIPQCRACGSMMPNSYDPCNSASCTAAKRRATSSFQPYNPSTFSECADCPADTGGLPGTFDPCSASGVCKTEQDRRTASNIRWSGSNIPQCQACGTLKANSFDPCKSAQCAAKKDALYKSATPYSASSLTECNHCPSNTGSAPDSYDPCSASGDCKTEQDRRTASNLKWSGSDIPQCQACGTLKANSFDPCKSAQCAAKKDELYKSATPYSASSLTECNYCPSNTGSSPDSYDPCSASGDCKTEQDRRTASNLKWSGSNIPQCQACGTLKANSFDPCNSSQCAAKKDELYRTFQPYSASSLTECNYCPSNTGSAPDSYDPCSASGDCKTEQDRRTASNLKWSGSDIPACQSCGTLKANSFDPCKSAQCAAKKDVLYKSATPYSASSLTECNHCPSNTGSSPDSYDPCSASGDCVTEQTRRTASNLKWSGSDIPACQACGTLKANSFDPCKSASCAAAKDSLYKSFQPYSASSLTECNHCPSNTGSAPDSYDPCSASGDCVTEQTKRTASNLKWSGSDIPACQACGTLKANSFDPCKSAQCAAKKKSLTDIFMPWTQATITPECDNCPAGTGSLPDSYTPCGPGGQCDVAQKSRTASGISWTGAQIPECRNCGSDQTSASWSPPPPPPPPPAPASASIAPPPQPASASQAPVTRSARPMVYPVVYTDGRRINPSEAAQICRAVGDPTQSSVATNAQINTGITSARKWCHDTIDSTVAGGGTYTRTANQTTQCGTQYKPVARDSTGKPIYRDVMCHGNRLPIGTVVTSPAGNLRVSAMEGRDTFVGSKEAFTGSQYTPAMTRGTMTSGGVSAGRIPLMPADMQGSTPTIGQGRATTVGYSTFTPRR